VGPQYQYSQESKKAAQGEGPSRQHAAKANIATGCPHVQGRTKEGKNNGKKKQGWKTEPTKFVSTRPILHEIAVLLRLQP
jgi:hypothetical protein